MNKTNDPAASAEQIVAFLDGETNPSASAEMRAQIATDPELRREAESLEQTWNLLDFLPMPRPASLGDQTRRLVAISQDRERRFSRARGWLLLVLGSGVLLLGSFNASSRVTASERLLLKNEEMLERLETYRAIHDIESLELLADDQELMGQIAETLDGGVAFRRDQEDSP